jgi:hypothetical protein
MDEVRFQYEIVARKSIGKHPLGRPRIWEDNVKIFIESLVMRILNS